MDSGPEKDGWNKFLCVLSIIVILLAMVMFIIASVGVSRRSKEIAPAPILGKFCEVSEKYTSSRLP